MSRFWSKGWEQDYESAHCDTCSKKVYFIEWTNGAADYRGGHGWAAVDENGEPDLYCKFFDEEQGWITDSTHYVKDDERSSYWPGLYDYLYY
jgi:hypothetical protein